MTIARDPMAARRWWWETWWCVALAIAITVLPSLWLAGFGDAPVPAFATAAASIIVAGAMLWLSRMLHGRVQPSVYFALPFAASPVLGLALPGFALWVGMARRPRLRAGLFVALAAGICAVRPVGWLALVAMILAAEVARARAVETDGARRGWVASVGDAAYHALPLAPAALVLAWRWEDAGLSGSWLASLARKPGWLFGALGDRWPLLDIGSVIIVALVIDRGYRDRRFRHAPMPVAAALGLFVLFVALPRDVGLGGGALALALLSIRCSAWVKRRRRAELACAAIAFLLVRAAAAMAGAVIAPDDALNAFAGAGGTLEALRWG